MSATHPVVARGRILVVEDDPEAALFAVHVLAHQGQFDVTHTADPAVALRLAADEHWDLVLTDMEMPGMTGLELLCALREVAPALVAHEGVELVDDEYLVGPIAPTGRC